MSSAFLLDDEALAAIPMDDLAPGEDHTSEDDAIAYHQGFFDSWDGTKMFWQSWEAADAKPSSRRGRIALMHGYGEHSSRYAHVAAAFVRAGYDVMTMDARGHGKSEGRDAHVQQYDEYVLDLKHLCAELESRWGKERGPLFVLGHSNGGLIALRYALQRPDNVAAFAVTCPMCKLAVEVPGWKAAAGKVMSKLWPTFALPTELDPAGLTHVKSVVTQYANDPLNKKVATSRWFTEAGDAQEDLRLRANRIKHPFLMLLGGSDPIVDPNGARDVFAKLGSEDKELEVYDPLFHEILNEHEWADIMRRIIGWLERQRAALAGASSESEEEE